MDSASLTKDIGLPSLYEWCTIDIPTDNPIDVKKYVVTRIFNWPSRDEYIILCQVIHTVVNGVLEKEYRPVLKQDLHHIDVSFFSN